MMIVELCVGALAVAGIALGSQVILNTPQQVTTVVVPEEEFVRPPTSLPSLADLLTLENSASIFFSYARESAKISTLLSEPNDEPWTVLVPANRAVMALSHKPQQSRHREGMEGPIQISEQDEDQESRLNVERWVSAHVIPGSVNLAECQRRRYQTLLKHKFVSFKPSGRLDGPEWTHYVLSPHIPITGKRVASNGILYFIDGTVEI